MTTPLESSETAGEATRGSAVRLGAEGMARLLGLLTTLVVANGLGVEDFGRFAILGGVAVLVAEVADLGLHGMAPRALLAGEFSLRAMLRAKAWLALATGALVALLAVSPVPLAALLTAIGLPDWVKFLGPFAALLAYFALSGWVEFLGVVVRTRGRRLHEAVVLVLLRATTFAAALLALARGASLGGLALAYALSTLPVVAVAAVFTDRSPTLAEEAQGPATARRVLAASSPLAVNGGLALLSPKIELFALGWLRGAADAGVFQVALRVVEALAAVPSAINGGAMPALTREALRREGPVRERTALTCALLAAPAATGLLLLAPGVLGLLLRGGFAAAALPLRVLAVASLPLFMNSLLFFALIAVGQPGQLPRLTGFRVGVALAAALILVPHYGLLGAALGFVASESTLLLVASRRCRRSGFPVPVLRPLVVGVLVSLPMAAVVYLVSLPLVASIGLGVVAYAVTVGLAWRWLFP